MRLFKLSIAIFILFASITSESAAQTASASDNSTAKVLNVSRKTTVKKHTPSRYARVKFDKDMLDFGTIKEDAIIEKRFEFTNVGTTDLVVVDAHGSCGCTIPTIPTMPIAPGAKGVILVKYVAKTKSAPKNPRLRWSLTGVRAL